MSEPVVVVHWTQCYPCQFGEHRDPPTWHTWADPDDIDHAARTGQPDPSLSPCGCPCTGLAPPVAERREVVDALRQLAARVHRDMPSAPAPAPEDGP